MKLKNIFIFLTVLSAVFACEQIDESALGEKETVEKVPMTFTAVIEKDAQTKTVLGEEVTTDGVRVKKLLWQPGDEIGVSPIINVAEMMPSLSKFTATLSSPSASTEFEGSAEFAQSYMAFYPYQESLWTMGNSYMFYFPEVQKYVEGSFDPDAAPMVAVADSGNEFEFKNLCGIVALQLKGTEAIESITFSGTDIYGNKIPLSGHFSVVPTADELEMYASSDVQGYTMTLDCVEPVQLNEATATPFYMMLPPATYANFTLIIKTSNNGFMMKSGRNLTITRSHLKPTAELEYMESVYVDLSAQGTANSYIVKDAGLYSFKANVVGNGTYGYVQNESFYPAVPDISPTKVKLLWEEKEGTIADIDIKDGKVVFMATGQEGNAFVAVTDDSDTILWSWHLWMTDQPQEQTYVNDKGTFYVLDRNLGAISAERGTTEQDWYNSMGLLYQWGRKDPFKNDQSPEVLRVRLYMEEIVQGPTTFVAENDHWLVDGDWSYSLWTTTMKTIYDPCPPGYRVAVKDTWYGFTKDGKDADRKVKINASGTFDKGWNFYINNDKTATAWYPASRELNWGGGINWFSDRGYVWAADNTGWYSSRMEYWYSSDVECYVRNIESASAGPMCGYPVRCMKDEKHEATSLPVITQNESAERTTTSIKVSASISNSGWSEVTDRGFMYSVNSDMSNAQTVSCGSGIGEFTCVLDGLASGTVYYVKAYATNAYGTSYTDIRGRRTMYSDGDQNNLSSEWVANCYMVDPSPASYCFDAMVIGNGHLGYISEGGFYPQSPEILPESVELLWEDVSGVVSDIMLQNGLVSFTTNGIEGNAVLAVRDALGTIIWSWHIWVTDQPEGHTYRTNDGKTFVVMDRYLGSTSAVVGDAGGALYYQWGRKDPFRLNELNLVASFRSMFSNLSEAIAAPMDYATGEEWVMGQSTSLWSKSMKTIYDPCPEGWRVPSAEVWAGIRKLIDHDGAPAGVVFGFYDTDSFWYPDTPRFDSSGNRDGDYTCDRTELWTAEYGVSYYLNYNQNYYQYRSKCDAYPVRCMKDE